MPEKLPLIHKLVDPISKEDRSSGLLAWLFLLLGFAQLGIIFEDEPEELSAAIFILMATVCAIAFRTSIVIFSVRRNNASKEGSVLTAAVAIIVMTMVAYIFWIICPDEKIVVFNLIDLPYETAKYLAASICIITVLAMGLAFLGLSDHNKVVFRVAHSLLVFLSVASLVQISNELINDYEYLNDFGYIISIIALILAALIYLIVIKQLIVNATPKKFAKNWSDGIPDGIRLITIVSNEKTSKLISKSTVTGIIGASAALIGLYNSRAFTDNTDSFAVWSITISFALIIIAMIYVREMHTKGLTHKNFRAVSAMLFAFGIMVIIRCYTYLSAEDYHIWYNLGFLKFVHLTDAQTFCYVGLSVGAIMVVSAIGLSLVKSTANAFRTMGWLAMLFITTLSTMQLPLSFVDVPGMDDEQLITFALSYVGAVLLIISSLELSLAIIGKCDPRKLAYEEGKTTDLDDYLNINGQVANMSPKTDVKTVTNEEKLHTSTKVLEKPPTTNLPIEDDDTWGDSNDAFGLIKAKRIQPRKPENDNK